MIDVRLSPEALADLTEIRDYIARDNDVRALSFTRELLQRCAGIGDMPYVFNLVPRYERQGIRRRSYRGYLIFYRVGEHVDIIRVISDRRDYAKLLFPE